MKTEEALHNINHVLSNFVGKKSEHIILETSYNVVKKLCEMVPVLQTELAEIKKLKEVINDESEPISGN